MTHKFLTGAAMAFLTTLTTANAADFSGTYAGVKLGYTFAEVDATETTIPFTQTFEPSGIDAGFYVGTGAEVGENIYAGLEAEVVISGASDEKLGVTMDKKSSVTLAGRVGYMADGYMPYVKAGVRRLAYDVDGGTLLTDESDSEMGYMLGMGVETPINDTMSFRAEYEFADYGTVNNQTMSYDLTESNIGIGLSFRF